MVSDLSSQKNKELPLPTSLESLVKKLWFWWPLASAHDTIYLCKSLSKGTIIFVRVVWGAFIDNNLESIKLFSFIKDNAAPCLKAGMVPTIWQWIFGWLQSPDVSLIEHLFGQRNWCSQGQKSDTCQFVTSNDKH